MKIIAQRTSMPFDNRGLTGSPYLSMPTQKSVPPFNNVPTIQDITNHTTNIRDVYPHAGGDWSPGEDSSKSYREKGDDYKRQDKDAQIIANMLDKGREPQQQWKVKVKGGSKSFISLNLAEKYLRDNNLPFSYIARVAQVKQNTQDDRVDVIADSLNKTFMVESINTTRGIKEVGSSFCIAPYYFLTCAHVIRSYNKNAEIKSETFLNATVNLVRGDTKYKAIVIAADPKLDMALLRCNIDTTPLEIESNIQIGEDIIAIGSPHGYENNVSTGTLGSIGRKVYFYNGAPEYMFIDLAVFPGVSGGPVIKVSNGKVVGIVTLIVSSGVGNYGLNAALPASYIESFISKNIPNYRSTNKGEKNESLEKGQNIAELQS